MKIYCSDCRKEVEPKRERRVVTKDKEGNPLFVPKRIEDNTCPECGKNLYSRITILGG